MFYHNLSNLASEEASETLASLSHEISSAHFTRHSAAFSAGDKKFCFSCIIHGTESLRYTYVRTWCVLRELCISMSKIASASEEPNSFELFRAPKIFEAQPQRALVNQLLTMQRYGRYLADKRKKTHNMLIHKKIQVNTSGAQVSAQVCERKQ